MPQYNCSYITGAVMALIGTGLTIYDIVWLLTGLNHNSIDPIAGLIDFSIWVFLFCSGLVISYGGVIVIQEEYKELHRGIRDVY